MSEIESQISIDIHEQSETYLDMATTVETAWYMVACFPLY